MKQSLYLFCLLLQLINNVVDALNKELLTTKNNSWSSTHNSKKGSINWIFRCRHFSRYNEYLQVQRKPCNNPHTNFTELIGTLSKVVGGHVMSRNFQVFLYACVELLLVANYDVTEPPRIENAFTCLYVWRHSVAIGLLTSTALLIWTWDKTTCFMR